MYFQKAESLQCLGRIFYQTLKRARARATTTNGRNLPFRGAFSTVAFLCSFSSGHFPFSQDFLTVSNAARIPGFPPETIRGEASSLLGQGPESPSNVWVALEQPRLAPVQPWVCSRTRGMFGTPVCAAKDYLLLPLSIYGESRNSGLAPGNWDPKPRDLSRHLRLLSQYFGLYLRF